MPTAESARRAHHLLRMDPQGRIVWVNAAFTVHTGFALAQAQGRTPCSLLAGSATPPEAIEHLRDAMRRGEAVYGLESIHHRRDGSRYAVRLDLEPEHDADGRICGWWSAQHDISEEVAAHEHAIHGSAAGHRHDCAEPATPDRAGQENRQQLVMAADLARVGLSREVLATGRWTPNAAARDLYGFPPDAQPIAIDSVLARIHPDDRPAVRAARMEAVAGRVPWRLVPYRICRPDGTVRHVQAYREALRDPSGQPIELLGAIFDVTELVDALQRERELRESQSMALELARIGVWELPAGSGAFDFDERLREIFGWGDLSRLVPMERWIAAVHADDRARVAAAWRGAGAGVVPAGVDDFRIVRADGVVRHLRLRAVVHQRPDGQGAGLRGIARDVTDEVEARATLRRAEEAVAQRDHAAAVAADRFGLLAAVSHEVRSPLNAMVVAAEQIERAGGAAERGLQPWIHVLRDAVSHLNDLAEELLRGASQESRTLADAADVVVLSAKLARVERWLRQPAADAGVRLQLDESLETVAVRAPRQRLRQVLLNVVGNAIKYNRPGGRILVTARAQGARALLVVEDDGLGMSAAQLERLFRPFDRLGRETEPGQPAGFGLGMYLVHRFVQAMGGRIEVTSEPGRGTRVLLDLPRAELPADDAVPSLDTVEAGSDGDAPAAGTEPAARAPVAVAAAPAPRVLAVDDDPVAPLLLQAQFAAIGGWAIEVVDSPVRALEALRRAEPGPVRLVLLDLDLGAVRGESVLGALRAAGYTGPVVAYTGDGTPETAAALQAAGFEAVCLKPVNTGQLAELLRRFATPGKSS